MLSECNKAWSTDNYFVLNIHLHLVLPRGYFIWIISFEFITLEDYSFCPRVFVLHVSSPSGTIYFDLQRQSELGLDTGK